VRQVPTVLGATVRGATYAALQHATSDSTLRGIPSTLPETASTLLKTASTLLKTASTLLKTDSTLRELPLGSALAWGDGKV